MSTLPRYECRLDLAQGKDDNRGEGLRGEGEGCGSGRGFFLTEIIFCVNEMEFYEIVLKERQINRNSTFGLIKVKRFKGNDLE